MKCSKLLWQKPFKVFSKIVWLSGKRTGFYRPNLRFRRMFALPFSSPLHQPALKSTRQSYLQEKNFKVWNFSIPVCKWQHSIFFSFNTSLYFLGAFCYMGTRRFRRSKMPGPWWPVIETRHTCNPAIICKFPHIIELVLKGGWIKIIHQFKLRPMCGKSKQPIYNFILVLVVNNVTQFDGQTSSQSQKFF